MGLDGKGLAVVCKWNEEQFGRNEETSMNIDQHWFVLDVLEDEGDIAALPETLEFYGRHCNTPVSAEIVDYFCLPGEEMVGICKTFWLKRIQRKWKKVYAEKNRVLINRQKTEEIIYRERHGSWRSELAHLPSLRGMLSV